MQRLVILFGALGIGMAVGACFDEELTLGLECESNADCGPRQECVQTEHQQSLRLAGVCRPEGDGCEEGVQPGCKCDAGTCDGLLVKVPASCIAICVDADDLENKNCEGYEDQLAECIAGVSSMTVEAADCFCAVDTTPVG